MHESDPIEKPPPALLGRLSEPVEVVPLDQFSTLAAGAKTSRTRYPQPTDP